MTAPADNERGPAGLPYRPCAGVVLMNAEGRIFAGRRIDNPADAWQMPQGGIDPDEDPRAAALRELWEETGIPPHLCEVVAETPDWVRYDLPPELVGRLALEARVALLELRPADGAGLEEMFLALTAETQREGAAA